MRIIRILLGMVLALTVVLIMLLITNTPDIDLEIPTTGYVTKYIVPTYNQDEIISKKIETRPDIKKVYMPHEEYIFSNIEQKQIEILCSRTIMANKNKFPQTYKRSCYQKPVEYEKLPILHLDSREQITTNIEIPYW